MLEQAFKTTAVALAGCLLLSSCSHFSQSGRQQLAYERYVRKQSHNRVRQQTKFKNPKKAKLPSTPGPSQPMINTDTDHSPQSVTSGESQRQ
jgi:hypothetical protein